MGSFSGFGPGLYEFFEGLADNNDKAWFTAHKSQYVDEVRTPLEDLFDDLEPTFGAAKLFRINRDVRFSHDKTPYKTAQAGIIHLPGGATRYLQVSASGLMVGVGGPHFDSGQIARYREAVGGRPGEALAATVDSLRRSGYQVGTLGPEGITAEGELKRVPSGFSPDHPRADLLRYKSLIAAISFDRPAWLATRRTVAEVTKRWNAMAPIADWLADHVGPGQPRTR